MLFIVRLLYEELEILPSSCVVLPYKSLKILRSSQPLKHLFSSRRKSHRLVLYCIVSYCVASLSIISWARSSNSPIRRWRLVSVKISNTSICEPELSRSALKNLEIWNPSLWRNIDPLVVSCRKLKLITSHHTLFTDDFFKTTLLQCILLWNER